MLETGSRTWWIALGGVLVIVLLGVVFLPPFHLLQRLQGKSYHTLTSENPIAFHQDGIQIAAAPADLDGSFGVRFDSVPQLTFLEGSAGDELLRAAQSLPANLLVKSPYYRISSKGQAPESTIIAIDIPNNAEPWETLDLYSWTGEAWQWVGGQIDTDRELILAQVGREMPESLVVMQVSAVSPAVSSAIQPDQSPASAVGKGVTHVLPIGLSLGEVGSIAGNPGRLPLPQAGDSFALMPSIRNWSAETEGGTYRMGSVNQAFVADMLGNPGTRQAHIDNIVALVVGQGYAGIDLDYRGVSVDWRDAYSALVADLANVLHAQGKTLSVAIEAPSPAADGGWDTSGYDWRALGQATDFVRVPFPINPDTFGASRDAYMAWALSQISRYKLFPILSTYSRDRTGGQLTSIDPEKALTPLGDVTGPDGEVVSPGETVRADLGGEALTTLQQDANSQTYTYTYHDDQDAEHKVTVITAASLATMLEQVAHYRLGGVFVDGLLEPGSDPAIAQVVQQFTKQAPPTASGALRVVWTVQAAAGEQLAREDRALADNESFEWTAPETAGEYIISAVVAYETGGQSGRQDSLSVSVATPETTDTPTPADEPEGTPTPDTEPPDTGADPADCLNATYVADITVPDNTRFEKGEAFVKTWRVRNNGSCAWPEGAKLTFVDGDALNAGASVDVGVLEAAGTTDISVDMAAPDADGSFQGVWRLADGAGNPFGTQLTVVIKVGEETAAPPPAPPPSGGGAFELGGHYRTWNYADKMKYAGMTWAKTQVHYGQDASGIVQTAHNLGFKIQLSALGSPDMVTQPNFHANYTAWVAALAAAGADAVEVWNEPNIDREWQVGQISPAAYTQLLCASYSAIKAARPGTAVISAAPAPTGWFGGCGGNGCDDLPWLQGMYNAGAASCMDYIGAHHNSGATSPSARSGHPADNGARHHSWYFLPQTELYYNVFGGARKLFYTEMGYASQEGVPEFSDQFAWGRGTNNAQQAAWLAEAVNLSRSTGMVRAIVVWNIDFSRYGYDPQDGYAIIRPGGGCPACDALHGIMQ